MEASISQLRASLPAYDDRRKMLALDALASLDGFRVLVSVTYEYVFGLRVCGFCPDCNNGEYGTPCQDLFGSNSTPEGGIFGRIDAGYTSIEAHKSKGSLHAHSQLFVQCLHQHTPLATILQRLRKGGHEIVQGYLKYKAHVSRQVYADTDGLEERLHALEEEWPEYEGSRFLVSRPPYLSRRDETLACGIESSSADAEHSGTNLRSSEAHGLARTESATAPVMDLPSLPSQGLAEEAAGGEEQEKRQMDLQDTGSQADTNEPPALGVSGAPLPACLLYTSPSPRD